MKIGIVLPQTPGYSETFFRSKMAGLVAMGHQVYLFAANHSRVKIEGVTIVEPYFKNRIYALQTLVDALSALLVAVFLIPRRSVRFLRCERESNSSWWMALQNLFINLHILRYPLDWIHYGFATMALRRENVGCAIQAKQAVSFRGFDISIYPLKHPGCYNLLWQTVDRVHTISNDLLQLACAQGLSVEKEVFRIPPAIDVEAFYFNGRTGQLPPKVRILSVGRLHWKKGYEYALAAFSLLKAQGVDFEAAIVGDGDSYERLAFSIYQRGLSRQVALVGRKSHAEVAQMMKHFDIYIQPSVQEGFCNSVLEAQCSGLLCVVTNAEGLAENILHGQTGLVVPMRNPEALKEAVVQMMGMGDDLRLEMVVHAQKRVIQEFNLGNQRVQFHQFYTN